MGSDTKPEVFIMESLKLDDEMDRVSEGEALSGILRMMRKKPKYVYIRTAKELRAMAHEFDKSQYRYLHISCHGNEKAFGLTLDSVPFAKFAEAFAGCLTQRRLFLSACSVAQPDLAQELFKVRELAPYSVTGPSRVINFSSAAATWACLYDLLFRYDSETIKGQDLRDYLKKLCELNGTHFTHFGRITHDPNFRAFTFGPAPHHSNERAGKNEGEG
jgi:hypothetical protein